MQRKWCIPLVPTLLVERGRKGLILTVPAHSSDFQMTY